MMTAIASAPPVETVSQVDLPRYAGKWYEIARFPNWFQRGCTGNVTATYSLQPGSKITVLNECDSEGGQRKSAKGTAKLADPKGPNSKLKVTFFWPFSGDYWILALDPEYRWALVGDPNRKYLWILARSPSMTEEQFRDIASRAAKQGFDTSRLVKTKQVG